jgi:hypothetical protein
MKPFTFAMLWAGGLFLAGCAAHPAEPLPIEREKLKAILLDIHLAEQAMSHLTGNVKDSTAVKYYDQVMKIHQVERVEIDTCLAILKRNPGLMEELYDEMLEEVDKRKVELMKG